MLRGDAYLDDKSSACLQCLDQWRHLYSFWSSAKHEEYFFLDWGFLLNRSHRKEYWSLAARTSQEALKACPNEADFFQTALIFCGLLQRLPHEYVQNGCKTAHQRGQHRDQCSLRPRLALWYHSSINDLDDGP